MDNGLVKLAQRTFNDLSRFPAELKLLTAVGRGRPPINGAEVPWSSDEHNADKDPQTARDDREVRSVLIRWLCTNSEVAHLIGPDGLRLVGARITGDLMLDYLSIPFPLVLTKCRIPGTISLVAAELPILRLTGSWTGPVVADGASIKHSLFLDRGFRSEGTISLVEAHVGQDVNCVGATFIARNSTFALDADHIVVGGDVMLSTSTWKSGVMQEAPVTPGSRDRTAFPMRVIGIVSFIRATIAGDFLIVGGTFQPPVKVIRAKSQTVRLAAIYLDRSDIKGGLYVHDDEFTGSALKIEGLIDMTDCSVAGHVDFYRNPLPATGDLLLEGFTYRDFYPSEPEQLLSLLERDTSVTTQRYRQAASYLQSLGDSEGAKRISEAMEAKLTKWWQLPVKEPIGFGYEPGNAFWGLIGITGIGALIYWRAYRMGHMVPTEKGAYLKMTADPRSLPEHYPRFQSLIYSLENTFPLVKLGQTSQWQCDPGKPRPGQRQRTRTCLRWFIWMQVILGWVLATLFVAAVSGIIQHK
jgi:hypothetical protein